MQKWKVVVTNVEKKHLPLSLTHWNAEAHDNIKHRTTVDGTT